MKIVILGPAYPYRGGIAALNERLAIQLIREGEEVSIFNFKLQYPGFLFPGKTQYTDDPAPEEVRISREVNSVNPFNWLKVGRKLKRLAPDLLIVRYWLPFMGPSLGTICRMVRRNKHTKVICIADNIIPHEKRPGDRLFTRYFAGGVDGYMAMSHEVGEDIRHLLPGASCRFTPHPVYDHYGAILSREEALKTLGLDAADRYLLFFGFIRDYKGLDLLLEALADERIKNRNVRLLVAGEFYSNEEYYLGLIQKYGLQDKVILHTDYIPNEEVNRYFCAADLIVQPYKTATQSGVTQVGYHFNKAMLVTKVGGLGEIVKDRESGYVVAPQAGAIADAMVDFYENHRQDAFEKATLKLKEKFSWSRMTEAIRELYETL